MKWNRTANGHLIISNVETLLTMIHVSVDGLDIVIWCKSNVVKSCLSLPDIVLQRLLGLGQVEGLVVGSLCICKVMLSWEFMVIYDLKLLVAI